LLAQPELWSRDTTRRSGIVICASTFADPLTDRRSATTTGSGGTGFGGPRS
jgi:hypothetical protein